VDGWPRVNGHAGLCWHHRRLHAIPHTCPFQGLKESSKIGLYPRHDGHEKIRFLCHPSCPPGLLLPSTAESRPSKTPTTGGMISRFHLPTRAHLRRTDSSHPRRTRAPPTAPGQGQQKCPVATTGSDITAAPPSLHIRTLRCSSHNRDQRRTAVLNRTLLTNEYGRVRKGIKIRIFYSMFEFSNFV